MEMENRKRRKLFWWNMPVDSDQTARVGSGMMRAVAIWFAVVVAIVVIGVVIAAVV